MCVKKMGAIRQLIFISHVWGCSLDFMALVHVHPGIGDEPLSIARYPKPDSRALIVTTTQEMALTSSRR